MSLSLKKKYSTFFKEVLNYEVLDPASYFEFYSYNLLLENKKIKKTSKITPNFKIESGKPISHAVSGKPDIEVLMRKVAFIIECSLKTGKRQFDDEHESTSRHYEEFKNKNLGKFDLIFGFFVSSEISYDIKKWFFKLFSEIKIIPVSLSDFINLMVYLHDKDIDDYEKCLVDLINIFKESKNQNHWFENISNHINSL